MSTASSSNVGLERIKADKRQYGGLILAFGLCAFVGSLAEIATQVGRDGGTSSSGIPLWRLIGACCQAFFGSLAIIVGFLAHVTDAGHYKVTMALCALIQLAWIPYITEMVDVGKQTANPDTQQMIPVSLEPSDSDIKFTGAMGILTILPYGFGFIGSLAFMSFALLGMQKGQFRFPEYYQGRLVVYSGALMLAGFTQLALGSFVLEKYGTGPLQEPLNVAVYTIFYPEISVAVGVLQFLTGGVGVFKGFAKDLDKLGFPILCLLNWICSVVLQIVVQVSYAPGGQFAAAVPTRACVIVGICFMPAYLDFKSHCAHPKEYYGLEGQEQILEQKPILGTSSQQQQTQDMANVTQDISQDVSHNISQPAIDENDEEQGAIDDSFDFTNPEFNDLEVEIDQEVD